MYEFHLFAGIGGGILGGLINGNICVGAVEIEEYPRKILVQRQTVVLGICERDFGAEVFPTPVASDGSQQQATVKVKHLKNARFSGRVCSVPYVLLKRHNMRLSPKISEWMMGFPISWSDLLPLETRKFQSWLRSQREFWNEKGENK